MNELKSKAQVTHCRIRISELLIAKLRTTILHCLISSLFIIGYASQIQAQTIPAAGKKFHLALSSEGTNLKYQFLITAQQSTQVAIYTTGGTVVNLTVPANDVVTYTLNAADVANMPSYNAGVFVGGGSVYIEATNLVCVYVRTADGTNSDASIIFPKEFYATNYDFVSRPADFNPSVLVSLDQSTNIAPLNGGFTATIPPRNSFSYIPSSIAGVRVSADFPVAAFVLGKGLAVDGVTKSDYYHQMLPVSESGKKYFIPVTLQGITSACFTATQVNTVVKDHTGATIATLANVGDYKCISVKADAKGAYIEADKPLGVGTYMLSKDAPGATGYNPAFAWCPSTEQLTTDVLLGVGTPGTIVAEHVLIVTRSWAKKMTYLSFKGGSRSFLTDPVWVDHPSGWSYCNYPIALGTGSYHFANYAGMIVYAYSGASGDANFYLAGVGHKGALQEPPPTELPDNIKEAKCSITPPKGKWSIKQRLMSEGIAGPISGEVFEMSVPLVGDIDNDGVVEIVCAGKSVVQAATLFACDSIKVFDALNKKVKYGFKVERFHGGFGTIAMADVDKDGFAEIFVATDGNAIVGNQGYIYCYSHTGVEKWKSKAVYTANVRARAFPYLNIVDFNGDGIPEIMANDRIFNAKTGDLLLDCNLIATGKDYGTGGGHQALDIASPQGSLGAFSATGDIDGDGLPEFIAGRTIYKISIVDLANPLNNACTPFRSAIAGTHTELGDGYTTVADIDLDGTLDVVVVRGSGPVYMFAWSGKTGVLLNINNTSPITATGGLGYGSIPFIGDLDGDGAPEIAFTGYLRLYAYKYDKVAQKLNPLWPAHLGGLTTNDQSCATTLSLFDFDQDGAMELIYRDERKLRIIDGKTAADKYTVDCNSWTMNEYPVIADVTGDGRANIVVLGKPRYEGHGNGYLYVYEADLNIGTPWAPARSVWNQWAYNAVNVNDDLTIPKYQFSTTTVFPGEDGILGTLDDVRPYNGFLMQQTRLDINGTPLFTAPNAEIRKQPSFVYNVVKDSMTVTVTVHNAGDAAFQNPFKITAYKNAVGGTPKLTHSYAEVINAGDSAVITFGIPKFKAEWTQPTFTDIVFRVNDKGNGYADQSVCDSSKRDFKTGLVIASDDRVLVFQNTGNVLNILKNDIYPASCTPTIDILLPLAKHGIYNKTTDTYTPNTDYLGPDTIRYKITCGAESSEAMVVISVVPKPDNISNANCFIDAPAGVWSFKSLKVSATMVSALGNPLAGDVDNDGKVELLVAGTTTNAYTVANTLLIFDQDLTVKYTITLQNGIGVLANVYSMADVNHDGYAEIFVCENDGYLYRYDFNGSGFVYSGKKVQHTVALKYRGSQPMLTDFNADGFPEIVVLDKVFDANTLTLLIDGNRKGVGDLGHGAGHVIEYGSAKNARSSIMAIADIDGDGLPELLAGSTVYKVTINSRTSPALNSFSVFKQANKLGRLEVGDGATAVADMDLDGKLDIIVSRTLDDVGKNATLYIWNPRTGEIMNKNEIKLFTYPVTSSIYGQFGPSVPFVGNISGPSNSRPEVVVISHLNGTTDKKGVVTAFDFVGDQLVAKTSGNWPLQTTDYSAATAITLFDFDQDGSNELIYRDCDKLRIINGADAVDKIATSPICGSATGQEYPIVVDFNNDGRAEIVVTGHTSAVSDAAVNGYLQVFGSSGSPWAPARKVWNQYSYNAVNVNNDLTIPKYQLNPATVFPGKDGVLGTADDVRPYNAFLQQQTTLNSHGTSLFLAPNAEIRKQPSFVYDPLRDSMTVSVTVHNAGDAAFSNPFKITAYKNDVGETPNHTHSYAGVINAGDSAVITFGIPRFKAEWMQTPFTSLVIQANDKGDGANDQAVCKDDKRNFKTGSVIASDDRVLVFVNSVHKIEILKNDIYPAACTPTIGDPLVQNPKYGSVAIVAGVINYTPTTDYIGSDTIRYKITCSGESSEAMVVINVVPKPDNIGDANCFIKPKASNWSFAESKVIRDKMVSVYQSPVVADLDNDGFVEIVTLGVWDTGPDHVTGYRTSYYIVYDTKTGVSTQFPLKYNNVSYNVATSRFGPIGIAKSTSIAEGLIVISGVDNYLYAYSKTGVEKWKSDQTYQPTDVNYNSGTVSFTDFDGDGYTEIYVSGSIFDLATGRRYATLGLNKAESEILSNVDIDGDGKQELIHGATVYTVTLNRTTFVGNITKNVALSLKTPPSIAASGMKTIVADFNLDGKLDVLVKSANVMYIWTPIKQEILMSTTTATVGNGVPFVGDIDNDGFPEILYTGVNFVIAYDIDENKAGKPQFSGKFTEKWKLPTSDASGYTGITLFDFNQDGYSELVYRDQTELRIINGSMRSHITGRDTIVYNLSELPCFSGTQGEYPVVVDVDKDGKSEIIVTGADSDAAAKGGYIRIYKSANVNAPWAPARKVWNQYAYNAVNVNEDLTIPKHPLNPATVFPGKDGVLGTADDVRPYNGFLMQQTSLNKDGNPLWPAPDFVPQTGWSINTTATTATISFCVKNTGDASGNSPLYVSVYKGDHTGTAVFTHQYAEVPAIGETKCYTLSIQNPSSYQTDQLIVVINDKGDATWQQPECEYDNNSIVVNLEGLPIARPDYITVMACDEVQFDYLTNDYRPAGTVVTSPTKVPKLGTFTTVGTDGKYTDTPPCNPRQLDTIGYKLCNGELCSETNIVVNIRTRPQIVLQDSCSLQPRLVVDYQYQDMTYKWEYSVDNATWVTESSSTTTFLNVNKSGWYRVKLKHGTTEVLVSAVHFEVIKKSMLAGDIIWYESGLR